MVTFSLFLQTTIMQKCAIIAGKEGLSREIALVTVSDAISSHNPNRFKKGKELVLSSSHLFDDDANLFYDFLHLLISNGASGLAVRSGLSPFIVSEKVARLADENNFPLILVPRDFLWSDIITKFYELKYNSSENSTTDLTTATIFLESSRAGIFSLMRSMKDLLDISSALVDSQNHILAEEGLEKAKNLSDFLNSKIKLEDALGNVFNQGESWFGICKLPTMSPIMVDKYIVFSSISKDIADKMFAILHHLASINFSGMQNMDEDLPYTFFLSQLVMGNISQSQIADFLSDGQIGNVSNWGIIIIKGENRLAQYHRFAEIAKSKALLKQVACHLLDQPEKSNLIVLFEVIQAPIDTAFNPLLREIFGELLALDRADNQTKFAVSVICNSPDNLLECYKQAVNCIKIGVALWPDEQVYYHNDICLFSSIQKQNLTNIDFSELAIIENSSKNLSFDGILTLELFLEELNYKKAGERLGLHENTMRYRIQKIYQLLNLSTDDCISRQSNLMKIKLWRLKNIL